MDDNTNNLLVSTVTNSNNGEEEERNETPQQLSLATIQDGARDIVVVDQDEEPMEEEETRGEEEQTIIHQVPDNVKVIVGSLIDHYSLSRDQFTAMYDEYFKSKFIQPPVSKNNNIESIQEEDGGGGGEGEEEKEVTQRTGELRLHVAEEPILARAVTGNGTSTSTGNEPQVGAGIGTSLTDQELQGEVNRLQSVVQSAMETYVSSPVVVNTPTRSSLTLTDEPLPSTFARELLQRDQSLVAQAIRKYLHQYSIPQREVVEKTGINQSHLSQHFTRGVPIKPAKRVKLYHWFEQDQLQRTGKLLTADGSITTVLESPKVEGYRRRPRWRWSPVATQILTEAFKKNRFPTREQRLELSRICNEAESAMNNGEPIQGPSGDTEGITEQRINTWFTNRRKGLVSPSTSESFVSGLSILASPGGVLTATPTLDTPTSELSAGGVTTPVRSQNITTSPLTINFTPSSSSASTPAATSLTSNNTTSQDGSISLTALSSINLQALLNQLQGGGNTALAPLIAQNLGQILVGQLPQGLMLQSPQGSITLDTLTKQLNAVDTLTAAAADPSTDTNVVHDDQQVGGNNDSLAVSGEEEIISNTAQPLAINSRQN